MPRIDLWQVPLLVMGAIIVVVLAVSRIRIPSVVMGWLRTAGITAVCVAGLLLLVANWGVSLGINIAQLGVEGVALYIAVRSYQATQDVIRARRAADSAPAPAEQVPEREDVSTPDQ
jgi:hypothetical protein